MSKLKGNKSAKGKGFENYPDNINHNGAPKGKRTSTIIKELLQTDVSKFTDNKTLQGLDTNTALAVELITMAFHEKATNKDKLNVIKEILNRIEGTPVQSIVTIPQPKITGITFVDATTYKDKE